MFLLDRLAVDKVLVTTPQVEKELWDPQDRTFYRDLLKNRFRLREAQSSSIKLEELGRLAALLSDGELSVMRLAMELAAGVVTDEPLARKEASKLKIKVNGTVSILAEGRARDWCTDEQCLEIIRRLRAAGMRVRQKREDEKVVDYVASLGATGGKVTEQTTFNFASGL